MNIAIIGLGFRGSENIKTLCRIDGVKIISICDLYEERTVVRSRSCRIAVVQDCARYKRA